MPVQPWNHTYVRGDDFHSPDTYTPFINAINERLKSIGYPPVTAELDLTLVRGANCLTDTMLTPYWQYQFGTSPPEYIAIVDPLCWPNGSPQKSSWCALQNLVTSISYYFVDPSVNYTHYKITQYNATRNVGRTSYPWSSGAPAYDEIDPGNDIPTLWLEWPKWPNGTGFTRKREPEITSLSCPGTIGGGRARFIASTWGQMNDGTIFLTDPGITTDKPPTPAGEWKYSTRIMKFVSGIWQVDTDQRTALTLDVMYGFAKPGDTMGPWILNDLRDAINQLTLQKFNFTWTAQGLPNYRATAIYASQAAADTGWAAATAYYNPSVEGGSAMVSQSVSSAPQYQLQVTANYGTVSVPNFCARTVTFYSVARDGDSWATNDPPNVANFNDNGQTAVSISNPMYTDDAGNPREDWWLPWAMVGPTMANPVITASPLGDLTVRPAWGPDGVYYGYGTLDPELGVNSVALVNWAVTGGYQYT